MSEQTPVVETTTTLENTNVTDPNAGKRGYKQCPKCKKFVPARGMTCPECNHTFVPKAEVKKPEVDIGKTLALIGQTREFVTKAGGIDNAKVLATEVAELLRDAGGLDSLISVLDHFAVLTIPAEPAKVESPKAEPPKKGKKAA